MTSTPVTHLIELQDVAVLELEFSLPQELKRDLRAAAAVFVDDDCLGLSGSDVDAGCVCHTAPSNRKRNSPCRETFKKCVGSILQLSF